MDYIFWIVTGYFSGSIPTGYLIGKLKGIDLTRIGSGSTGATNVLRNVGKIAALITLVIDVLKGFIPVYLVMSYFCRGGVTPPLLVVLVGLASILGHSKSVFLKFKGGKSSATGLGILIAISWKVAVISFLIWIVVVFTFRYSSLGSIITCPLVPLWMYLFHMSNVYILFTVVIAVYIVLVRHRDNIKRLIKGTEPKIGQKI